MNDFVLRCRACYDNSLNGKAVANVDYVPDYLLSEFHDSNKNLRQGDNLQCPECGSITFELIARPRPLPRVWWNHIRTDRQTIARPLPQVSLAEALGYDAMGIFSSDQCDHGEEEPDMERDRHTGTSFPPPFEPDFELREKLKAVGWNLK